MGDRKYRVLGRTESGDKKNNVAHVYRLPDGKDGQPRFTRNADNPELEDTPGNPKKFTKAEADQAVKWGNREGVAVYCTKSKYPFLVLDEDTKMGNDGLAEKLNKLGERRKRYLWCGEFLRSKHRQWELRMDYLQGHGNLAAKCDTTYSGEHSWEQCKPAGPSQSNHASGDASDTSYLHSGRSGNYTNVGNDSKCRSIMHDIGLCLPVGGEPWHVERGNTWRA